MAFDPNQARDDAGMWTADGGSSGSPKAESSSGKSGKSLDAKAEKSAKRYASRAKFWSKKADEFKAKAKSAKSDIERKAAEEAAKHAAKKAAHAAKLVEKAAGPDHEYTKQAKEHANKAGGSKEAPAKSEPKVDVPKSESKTDAKAEKTGKRYAQRAKFWDKKAKEFSEKAKNAKSDIERKAAEEAAKQAAKKAEQAAAKVEKAVGADHPLAKEAKASAESAKSAKQTPLDKMKAESKTQFDKFSATKSILENPNEAAEYAKAKEALKKLDEKKSFEDSEAGKAFKEAFEAGMSGKTTVGKPAAKAEKKSKKNEESFDADDVGTFKGGEVKYAQLNKMREEYHAKLDSKEIQACLLYSGHGYVGINGSLRKGDSSSHSETIANLDSAISKHPLTQDTTLHRGMDGVHIYEKMTPGTVFTDKGYSSTSAGGEAAFKDRNVIMKITAPKGTLAAPIPTHYGKDKGKKMDEREMLLARGTKFRVDKIQKSGSKVVIAVTVISQGD